MIDTNYIVAGVNVAKCEHCGFDKYGKPRQDGGNVFIKIGLKRYEKVRHDCFLRTRGRCRKCGRLSFADFVHVPAPKASEETIREIAKTVTGHLGA